MDIVRVELEVSPGIFDELLARDRADEFRSDVEQALASTGFHGHLCWPLEERSAVCLIAEGDQPVGVLGETLEGFAGGTARTWVIGEVPDELAELPRDGRSRVLIEMGLEGEGKRCQTCLAVPPHEGECPWVLRDEGLASAQDTHLYSDSPTPSVPELAS